MKVQGRIVAWALVVALGMDAGWYANAETTAVSAASSPATTSRPAATTVRVKTAEEFVTAIASDRVIELEEGDYVLTDVPDRKMKNIVWRREFDGKNLVVRKVSNLKIIGVGKKPAHLIVRPSYVFVISFEDSDGVILENLRLGHAPEKGTCEYGVIGIKSSTNVTMTKCDLYGCGTEGLTLEKCQHIQFNESTIRDCSYGILTANECRDISFNKSKLHGNEQFWGLKFSDSEDITLTDCTIENNRTDKETPLISAISCSKIALKNCTIRKNNTPSVVNDGTTAVTIEGGRQEENAFTPTGGAGQIQGRRPGM